MDKTATFTFFKAILQPAGYAVLQDTTDFLAADKTTFSVSSV